ncbi:NfeD family protein [Breoghania sp. L-A4]|uniref:NfeD family protein n=1 Tax=Breoghania sp. L-A4 TaxID=2304600 RepID=UPI000E35F698|nr:NfeD family protein [Breoghania sp. L-A4]AXS41875.1 NfeD family protein [Breoghania sp. L-A4]
MSYAETLVQMLGPWSWHVAGLLLLGLEILVPGTFFLWFGVAALIVGTLALFVDMPWQLTLLLFMAIALICLFAGRRLMKGRESGEGDSGLNRRGQRYVGRHFIIDEPIVQGAGRLHVDDTIWRISGPDLPAGARVTVTGVNGASLVVAAAVGD